MPGEISRSNPGPKGSTPLVPSWVCLPGAGMPWPGNPIYCQDCLRMISEHALPPKTMKIMKALSVKLPWWSRIEVGDKPLEVRSWTTKYRGELLICASRGQDIDGMQRVGLGSVSYIKSMNRRGRAICIVDLVDCRPMTKADEAKAMVPYKPGLFVWVLANPRPTPGLSVKGRLGLFDVEMGAPNPEAKDALNAVKPGVKQAGE